MWTSASDDCRKRRAANPVSGLGDRALDNVDYPSRRVTAAARQRDDDARSGNEAG